MKKSGSILIFTLFIMIVISLFAILITIIIKDILKRGGIFYKFEKTYYLAYGGIELELTKIKYHNQGFEDSINSGSNTNKKNWKCKKCFFTAINKNQSKIIGKNWQILEKNYNNCSNLNPNLFLKLKKTGEGIVLPLFINTDSHLNNENPLSGASIVKTNNYIPIELYRSGQAGGVHYIFGITDGTTNKIITGFFYQAHGNRILLNNTPLFTNDKIFWGFFQKTDQNMLYCFQFKEKIPTNRNLIISKGKYQEFNIILKSFKFSKIPEYIVYSIIK